MGFPVQNAAVLDELLFGTLPSAWLQTHVLQLSPDVLTWVSAIVHSSWFVAPWLFAILVSWKRAERAGSFFRWWIAIAFAVNPIFALFPVAPPWMVDAEIVRINAIPLGDGFKDPNPLAAMPSLHVAVPVVLGLWFVRERWTLPAMALFSYATLISFEIVFSGEHYVVDIVGGVAVAAFVALAARPDYRALFDRMREMWRSRAPSGRRVRGPVPTPGASD